MSKHPRKQAPVWLTKEICSIEDFRAQVELTTDPGSVPLAAEVIDNIPVYDGKTVCEAYTNAATSRAFMAEWNEVLATGPGIVVVKNSYDDLNLIDDVTQVLNEIIEEERQTGAAAGDHFAAAGANSRIWNSHEKLCMAAPELFARYNANPVIAMISQAWLGPLYQITMQVNVVHPGGKAQDCHRDYHMGFQSPDALKDYPARIHGLSAMLTLQGGIAHCDVPLDSGPTKLLPYSQTYLPGYIAAQLPDFREYFEEHCVQLPLNKGDMLYFNPAVFHAAGENKTSDIDRMVNLMQVGSGYGRSIEIVDRTRMSAALYPVLKRMADDGALDSSQIQCVIAACAEGYPFPANLDLDSPLSGMAPDSQQHLMHRALASNWSSDEFEKALRDRQNRVRSH
ncbi:phytanoyl-CoA dioxygenase family protein [Ruegeria sp. 2205SS24-7]|uniref:phytanoyl-CoA dioxygenase family protein n=1 Tax=Ruegeria discodermiae TaxID=3064389 RepID=UPI00274062DD|nr:phytanoyl-CoA dioxygenase family protein [Ruegeria sp. 2205SS24-7]MDP5218906.1 phytanoyl-CoA dioxygenase family protein [Ruegeria sp. 2205SS24-7]